MAYKPKSKRTNSPVGPQGKKLLDGLTANKNIDDIRALSKISNTQSTSISNLNTEINSANQRISQISTSKQDKLTLTTVGTSGPATLNNNTLNVPNYSTGLTVNTTTITGGVSGRLLFDDAGVVGETNGVHWDKVNSRMGFGTVTPGYGISHIGTIGVAGIFSQRDFGFGAYSQITQRASYIAYTTDGTTGLAIGTTSGAARIQGFNGLPATSDKPIFLQSLGGNVGIGITTDAGFKLDVNGTSRYIGIARFQNTSSNWLNIDGSASGTNHSVISNRFNQIQIVTNTGAGDPHIALLPATGGNVGIGTSSPGSTLDIQTNGYTGVTINSGANNNTEINFKNTAYPTPRWTIRAIGAANGSSGNLTFQRNASTFPLTITSGDNVLINTTTDAGFRLDVNGTARIQNAFTIASSVFNVLSASSSLFFVDTGSNNYRIANFIGYGGYHPGSGTNNTGDVFSVGANPSSSANGTSFFRLNYNGGNSSGVYGSSGNNVSVAQLNATTASRLYLTAQGSGLLLQGGTSGNSLISTVSNGDNLNLRSENGTGSGGGGINYLSSINGSNHSHRFFHNNVEQMRLQYSGNLLIGTTTDAGYKLDVNGTGRFTGSLTINNDMVINSVGDRSITWAVNDLRFMVGTNNIARFFTTGTVFISTVGVATSTGTSVGPSMAGITASSATASATFFANPQVNHLQTKMLIGGNDGAYGGNTTQGIGLWIYGGNNTTNNSYGNVVIAHDGTTARGNVLIGTSTNVPSAVVNVNSTTQGFLPPRMTNAQMVAIATPSEGLVVYDLTNRKLCCYDGATWQNLF